MYEIWRRIIMRTQVVWLTAVLLIVFMGFNPSNANILVNGGFEDGVLGPWSTYDYIASGLYTEVVEELVGAVVPEDPIEGNFCLHVVVPTVGANSWDVGLRHMGHVFEAGKKYTLSAFLKCNEGTLQVTQNTELEVDPWTKYGEQYITMTEEWCEWYVTTSVLTAEVDPGAISFHIAFAPGDFWIDGVRFYEGDYVPIPAPGAILLGSIGVGLVGWLRRRRTL
jgi:hypothetical protein